VLEVDNANYKSELYCEFHAALSIAYSNFATPLIHLPFVCLLIFVMFNNSPRRTRSNLRSTRSPLHRRSNSRDMQEVIRGSPCRQTFVVVVVEVDLAGSTSVVPEEGRILVVGGSPAEDHRPAEVVEGHHRSIGLQTCWNRGFGGLLLIDGDN